MQEVECKIIGSRAPDIANLYATVDYSREQHFRSHLFQALNTTVNSLRPKQQESFASLLCPTQASLLTTGTRANVHSILVSLFTRPSPFHSATPTSTSTFCDRLLTDKLANFSSTNRVDGIVEFLLGVTGILVLQLEMIYLQFSFKQLLKCYNLGLALQRSNWNECT